MNARIFLLLPALFAILYLTSGCAPVVVGGAAGAAYGGYKGATDERSVGTMVDDSVISTSVKTKMVGDKFVKARHVDVDVLNGVVYLIGVVESDAQKQRAADIAGTVDGVRSVENQLVVGQTSAGQALSNTILTSKIRTELIKDPDIRSTNVDVDTNTYSITLTGVVRTAYEKNRILTIARSFGENRDIVDNLTVSNQ